MPATLKELEQELSSILQPEQFRDYCPNGLQVEGKSEVRRIVTGVTANLALIEAAAEQDADALLVHHGYFWRGEDTTITGIKRRRIQALLRSDMSLLAYHLPLDAHHELGNNAQLAALLGFRVAETIGPPGEKPLVMLGKTAEKMSVEQMSELLQEKLQRRPLVVAAGDRPIERVAWCTGAAQGFIDLAAGAGVDAYITGEVSEQTVHIARETGIHFFAAGHHATERYGVQALGEHLAERFALEHRFIDIDNPA